jgi:hypothetical protein
MSTVQSSILEKCNSINKFSIQGRPVSSKQNSNTSANTFFMYSAYKNANKEIIRSRKSKITLSSNKLPYKGHRLDNYRSVIGFRNKDLDTTKSNKIINSY